MAAITEGELLAAWEAALGRPAVARALALAGAACRRDPAELSDLPLGRRDALLLDLRERCFGPQLSSETSCPRCAERLELMLDVADIRVPVEEAPDDRCHVEVAGVEVEFRLPTSGDLLALGSAGGDARRRLLETCVVERSAGSEALSDEILAGVAARLPVADPQADVVLSLACWSCGHEWDAPFDVAAYLWMEVDAYARRLLFDVHSLASAYGWSEAEVLAVSPARRRFYLDEVAA
ncbi:hypothetical protein ACQP2Y_12405 [Actinoplanes sp. CA-051413]|uniref:T4 family baseplate hub assembly chaperone n=1 Tax=Actinoplanes sp. CA-051413 TaxID=3239899 RepID=UPI003D9A0B34